MGGYDFGSKHHFQFHNRSPFVWPSAVQDVSNVDISAVKSDISAKLSVDGDLSSASELTNIYNEALAIVLDKHTPPVRKMMVITRASQSWFRDDIDIAKLAKRAAERRRRNSGLTVHKEICLNARTRCNGLLDAAKTSYHHDKIT